MNLLHNLLRISKTKLSKLCKTFQCHSSFQRIMINLRLVSPKEFQSKKLTREFFILIYYLLKEIFKFY